MAYDHQRRRGTDAHAGVAERTYAPGKRTLTESRYPIQAKGGDPTRTANPAALRALDGGARLPDPVRSRMEHSFGADFGDVRVHVGDQARTIGALAYTSGSHIHFAPGQYAPDTGSGQELIGHELAHVVQQRDGRVSMPQAKGAPINADGALEAEADAAGARAARGEPAGIGGGRGGAVAEGPIQRAVGFEFEMLNWSSRYTDEEGGPIGKGVHIADLAGFSVEGEDSHEGSTIEFVVQPLSTAKDVDKVVGTAAAIAKDLSGKVTENVAVENRRPVSIDGSEAPRAGMHASPAVPLSSIPALAMALDDANMTKGEASMVPALEQVDANSGEIAKVLGKNPSEELRGLLTLTVYYLRRGRQTGRAQFPKELTAVMARTTFTKMFRLLPEHGFFSQPENAEVWERLVLQTFAPEHDSEEVGGMPVFSQHFTALPPGPDGEVEGKQRLDTTRHEWLSQMPEQDLLSRGHDERFEGMGAYGNATDRLRVVEEVSEETSRALAPFIRSSMEQVKEEARQQDEHKQHKRKDKQKMLSLDSLDNRSTSDDRERPGPLVEAPLFELRQTGGGLEDPDGWVKRARAVFDLVDEVNQHQIYDAQAPEKTKKLREKNYNAPFMTDNTPVVGGLDRTAPPQQIQQLQQIQQPQNDSDDEGCCCCCCWPFSLFCRCGT